MNSSHKPKYVRNIQELLAWADNVDRVYNNLGSKVTSFVIPQAVESDILNMAIRNPVPKDGELRLDKTKRGITLFLRNRPVWFTPRLNRNNLFVLEKLDGN